jgi:hypothetical protein
MDQYSKTTNKVDATFPPKTLKILGLWIISLINLAFISFIIDVRLNHSHLKLNNLPLINEFSYPIVNQILGSTPTPRPS